MLRQGVFLILAAIAVTGAEARAEDQPKPEPERLFSGPQVGEKLPPFRVRGVFDADAGKELDFVARADGKPIVLVFVHDVNRQSVGMTRALTAYTVGRAGDGVVTGVVWLDDDATAAEATLRKIRHALTPGAPTGVSLDGREGPGSYGLNRNVMLTVLVGHRGKVTANFAMVQPSLQVDLPRIVGALVAVAGGRVPPLAELTAVPGAMRKAAPGERDPNLGALLRPVIRKDASPDEVDRAAAAVEAYVGTNEAARDEVGRIATTLVGGGKLEDYGTAKARDYIRKWAKAYGKTTKDEGDRGGNR
jgi:hypothetical protein